MTMNNKEVANLSLYSSFAALVISIYLNLPIYAYLYMSLGIIFVYFSALTLEAYNTIKQAELWKKPIELGQNLIANILHHKWGFLGALIVGIICGLYTIFISKDQYNIQNVGMIIMLMIIGFGAGLKISEWARKPPSNNTSL